MAYPSQQNATDQTANLFWLLALLTIGAMVLWWTERSYIVKTIFWVRNFEIVFLQHCVGICNKLLSWVGMQPLDTTSLMQAQQWVMAYDPTRVKFREVEAISSIVGRWLRYPVAVLLGIGGAWLIYRNKTARFNARYTMDSLKKLEVQNWPQITPALSLNLLNQDLDVGPWAMAKLPFDFCKLHDLLQVEEHGGKKFWGVKAGAAERVFALQLGSIWKGIDALPMHVKALLVIFIARASRQNAIADRFLVQIAKSAWGRLNFSGVEEQLEHYRSHTLLAWLEKRHAYIGTLLASLLEIARHEGVLATAEFLWLKPMDRRLWYLLNSVGRQTVFVEAAGLYAHWLAEKRLKRLLRTPFVIEGVKALAADVREILYVEEKTWHTTHAA